MLEQVMQEILVETDQMAAVLAQEVSDTAIDLHENAPRNNPSVNYFGLHRGDTIPAPEFGNLLKEMSDIQELGQGHKRVIVNYLPLEIGYAGRSPMQMAAAVMARLGK